MLFSLSQRAKILPCARPIAAAYAGNIRAGEDLGHKLPIFNHWNASCYVKSQVRVGDFRQMEVKILMLLALIAAIATAAHVGARGQSQERAN
jgi:hypothetical protein